MTPEPIVVLVTVPDAVTADKIAYLLVEERLAACVNIVPSINSVYQWQGKIHKDAELLLIIKTVRQLFVSLSTKVKSVHPYDLPEIIALPLAVGDPDYLKWVLTETKAGNQHHLNREKQE